jgi:hypothetical protein
MRQRDSHVGLAQHLEAVPGAEEDQAVRHRRESEEVDLVLGDEDTFDLRVDPGKAPGIEGEVLLGVAGQQGMPTIENPETDTLRFVAEAVAAGELAHSGSG